VGPHAAEAEAGAEADWGFGEGWPGRHGDLITGGGSAGKFAGEKKIPRQLWSVRVY
jgi:hypothetical protein